MLYHLIEYFKEIGIDIPGQGLFSYLSFRAIAAFTLALLISIFAGRRIIAWLQKKQIGETIRDLGLEGQLQKKGTPTMGGIIIFISVIIPVLLLGDLSNIYNILLIISTIWFFLIGFTDDYIKVFKKNKEGLSEKGKLMAQGAMALAIGLASDEQARCGVNPVKRERLLNAGADVITGDFTKLDDILQLLGLA